MGLLVGLPPFHIRKVSAPLVVGGECLVQFEAKMPPCSGLQCYVKEVLWVAHWPKECRIKVRDQGHAQYALHLDARMVPFDSTELGVLLVLDVYTTTSIEEETLQGIVSSSESLHVQSEPHCSLQGARSLQEARR